MTNFTEHEINLMVAEKWLNGSTESYGRVFGHIKRDGVISINNVFNPCQSWADAGPIIEEFGITLIALKDYWLASRGDSPSSPREERKSPLLAAMLVYLEAQS